MQRVRKARAKDVAIAIAIGGGVVGAVRVAVTEATVAATRVAVEDAEEGRINTQ